MPSRVTLLPSAALLAILLTASPAVAMAGSAEAVAPRVSPAPAVAATVIDPTAASMARSVLVLLNRDRAGARSSGARCRRAPRVARPKAIRVDGCAQRDHAYERIRLARSGDKARRIATSFAGECVGWTNATWGSGAARWLYNAWKHSPEHWSLMMSNRFTRIGVGFSYHASDQRTYSSLLFARL